ncbi:hypothetical protein JCM19298_1723 [Nonlabens ulvanivorans]|nr:hypothetical protein JCM19297_3715 [Nonlabens ulvanivorans]GAK94893.1 hypothetical protein JCM19298_1723 [Nonlabens ulvanivorans]
MTFLLFWLFNSTLSRKRNPKQIYQLKKELSFFTDELQ